MQTPQYQRCLQQGQNRGHLGKQKDSSAYDGQGRHGQKGKMEEEDEYDDYGGTPGSGEHGVSNSGRMGVDGKHRSSDSDRSRPGQTGHSINEDDEQEDDPHDRYGGDERMGVDGRRRKGEDRQDRDRHGKSREDLGDRRGGRGSSRTGHDGQGLSRDDGDDYDDRSSTEQRHRKGDKGHGAQDEDDYRYPSAGERGTDTKNQGSRQREGNQLEGPDGDPYDQRSSKKDKANMGVDPHGRKGEKDRHRTPDRNRMRGDTYDDDNYDDAAGEDKRSDGRSRGRSRGDRDW